ncbi:hypothetical protein SAMN06265795_103300 [Noviherbaspirillum humi]|uniref:Uncharacterized protein n=2 Tax=Noviherbaspirillum humi TaxID=1688639 RepID=A0A239FCZ7_9BURK|nr:hypothetical protein SAMN06265795_103300 [Noviherbaspirillum humi]
MHVSIAVMVLLHALLGRASSCWCWPNLAPIFTGLSPRRSALHVLTSTNRLPLLVAGAAVVMPLATLYLPALAGVFRFALVGWM